MNLAARWRSLRGKAAADTTLSAERGGRVTDLAGAVVPASGCEIVASNGAIHEELLPVLAPPQTSR